MRHEFSVGIAFVVLVHLDNALIGAYDGAAPPDDELPDDGAASERGGVDAGGVVVPDEAGASFPAAPGSLTLFLENIFCSPYEF